MILYDKMKKRAFYQLLYHSIKKKTNQEKGLSILTTVVYNGYCSDA